MRAFIKTCSGLFVVTGMAGCVFAVFALLLTGTAGGVVGIFAFFGLIIGAAATTLIGSTAYMLCSIDERIEGMTLVAPQIVGDVGAIAAPAAVAPSRYG